MTTRDDVAFDLSRSPRIAQIAAPSIEMIMQDYVDTTRPFESSFEAMSHPFLMSASGKEDLGGGTLVSITVEEQDLKLSFQARTTAAQTGTVTTGSGPPDVNDEQTFIDTSATFITNNVTRGSLVINFTDMSVADVAEVVSETELITVALVNGTDDDYDIGDAYQVYNIVQVKTTGGNLVAVDAVDVTFPAILPTAFTQVLQTTASSGTIQELTEIRFATYQNAAWVDVTTSNTGTTYPNGTPLQPVNNFPDAKLIADALGLIEIRVIGDATLDTGDNLAGFEVIGDNTENSTITINTGADVSGSMFTDCTITGVLDGDAVITAARIQPPLSFVEGSLRKCLIEAGTITLGGSSDVNILDCWSGVAGLSTPIIDFGGSGRDLLMRNWSGGVQIDNKTGADNVSIDLTSGQVTLDSTVTAGTIVLRGVGDLTDNSSGATVNINALVNKDTIAAANWDALTDDHSVVGSFGQFIKTRLLTVSKFFGMQR